MIIITEGPDCAAKTSLCLHISKTFNIQYFKESLSYSERLQKDYNAKDNYKKLTEVLLNKKQDIIVDRFAAGDIVNPIVLKDGRQPLSLSDLHEIETPLKKQALLITCLPPLSFVENCFSQRGEDVAKEKDIRYLMYLYHHLHELSSIKKKKIFDVTNDMTFKKIDSVVKKFLK